MATPLKLPFISLFFFAFTFHTVSTLTPDGFTPLSLLNHINLPSSVSSSWNSSDSTPCHWNGIHCDLNHNVISLSWYDANVSGTLGKEIGKLKFLETLDLPFNKISGPIPSELANCTNLVKVDVQSNLFTGELPSVLGNLQKLEYFYADANQLTGNIPESLFFIPNLYLLSLSYNHFTGVIPSSIGNLSELISLTLFNNKLSGNIPDSIGNCTKLKEAWFDSNLLVGTLPDSLHKLESLVYFDVSSNGLDGTISFPSRNRGKNLTWLDFSDNYFHGEIPDLGNSSGMEHFLAENNSLMGKIPSSLGSLRNLFALGVGGNPLSGEIPPEIWNCTSLMYLGMYGLKLSGGIPREFGKLRKLEYLIFHSNNLTGMIPTELGKLSKLVFLDISWNSLTGSLAPLAELHSLVDVNVSHNIFDGPIPSRLLKLSPLSFSDNLGLCCPYQSRNSTSCRENSDLRLCEPVPVDRKKCGYRQKATTVAVGLSILCAVMLTMLGCYLTRFRNSKNQECVVFPGAESPLQHGELFKVAQRSNKKCRQT